MRDNVVDKRCSNLINIEEGTITFYCNSRKYGSIVADHNYNIMIESNTKIKGNLVVSNDLIVSGNIIYDNSNESYNINNGSVVVKGGLGVLKNVNIGKQLTVNQNIVQKGNILQINVDNNDNINDNVAGILFYRNKHNVLKDSYDVIGNIKNAFSKNKLVIDHDINCTEWIIKVTHGIYYATGLIKKYYQGTITLENPLPFLPEIGDIYELYKNKYSAIIYNEKHNSFVFCYATSPDIITSDIPLTCNIKGGSATFDNTITANNIATYSDLRMKKNINDVDNIKIFDIINNLHVKEYLWKSNDKEEIGLIAQQVENILPNVVHTDNYGFKSITYDKLVPILIKAIQYLYAEI